MLAYSQEVLVGAGLLALLLASLEAGFRLGCRGAAKADPSAGGQIGAVQGALLGLLGLLLAFSFSAAGSRFMEKQDLIVQEANAIGTAYLRADLIEEPHRSALKGALRRYTEQRLEISADFRTRFTPEALAETERLQGRMWVAAVAGVNDRPDTMEVVLPPLNDVIDLHATRLAAGRKHLPGVVMGLLIASSALSLAVIGYGAGMGGRRRAVLTVSLSVLIGVALWITVDLDHPRGGLLRLSDAPLAELQFGTAPAGG